jgi:hypothetical protein
MVGRGIKAGRLALALVMLSSLSAVSQAATSSSSQVLAVHVRSTGTDYNAGRPLPVIGPRPALGLYAEGSEVGDRKLWFALDEGDEGEQGGIYPKSFRLRAVGRRSEIWVAQDLSFPPGDCRNDDRIAVTDKDIRYLVRQFDENIYPAESRAFSRPPRRDGTDGEAPQYIDVGPRYYKGPGGKIVVLVDNVRDANYYDDDNQGNKPYIIGFFYSFFNELTDRNVMTIDAFDWKHRTRRDPPHEPAPDDLCQSMPARPLLIEQTFAHEYQHLLEYYEDENETNWVNEGLSDWAQTLVGYANPRLTIADRGFDRHIECFLGWCNQRSLFNPNPTDMGPENSLTMWREEGGDEILADYGAPYTFMELLHGRYGNDFMRSLHRNNLNGLRSLRRILRRDGVAETPRGIVADWAAAVALDEVLDDGALLNGGRARLFRVPTLTGRVNWSTPHTHDSPGAPPNGSDYVRLRDGAGTFIGAGEIDTLGFSVSGLPPRTTVTLQLIAYDDAHTEAWIARPAMDDQGSVALSGAELDGLIGNRAEAVAAIVTFHDPTESQRVYARYTLTVNDVLQPGG